MCICSCSCKSCVPCRKTFQCTIAKRGTLIINAMIQYFALGITHKTLIIKMMIITGRPRSKMSFVLIRCIYFPSAFSMRRLAKKNTIISIAVVTIRLKSEPFLPMYKLIRFHFGKSKDITPTSIPVKDSDKRAKI